MTVSTTGSRVRYEGDGATSVFPIPFKFVDNAHVKVTLRDAASLETPWSEGSQYALSGAGGDGGGTLTVLTEPVDHRPRAGETLVIALDLPFTQDKAFPLGGAFPTTQVEEGLDLAALRDAQLAAFDARAFSVPATDAQVGGLELPIDSLRAGRYLGFDAQGRPALLAGTAEAADVSDKTVLPTGAGAARSLADLFGLGALTAENVKLHGAKGDAMELSDGTVTDGSAVLGSGSVTFTDADVGKVVAVEGAGTAGVPVAGAAAAPVDAAWQEDQSAGTFVDLTAAFNDGAAGDVEPFPASEAVGDAFYIGHAETFTGLAIDIGTAGVGGAVSWEYWDGAAWSALPGLTDGTSGFTAAPGSHDVTWTLPGDWATNQINRAVNGERLYYVRARLTTVYTTNPVLDQGILKNGRIRISATAHGFNPGEVVTIKGIVGTVEANGSFEIVRAGLDAFDLAGSDFANAYVSGGTAHGWLVSTIASVSAGDATLAANAGASIAGTARFLYGTEDTAAVQAAIDTGKTVVVPNGDYITDRLTVATEGQKVIGMGGRLIAKPGLDLGGSTDNALINVLKGADLASIEGLYLDNPTEQHDDDNPDTTVRGGILVTANRCRIEANIVRRFLDGIKVSSGDVAGAGLGQEIYGTRILGNLVWENLGAGGGTSPSSPGENRGDGIVNFGSGAVIANNIVHVKRGYDARVGIQNEGLPDFHAPDPEQLGPVVDRGVSVTGNVVLTNGIAARNGRWRRSIVAEGGMQNVSITGNFVQAGSWWGIAAITSADVGHVSVVGNTIHFDRPEVDQSGHSGSVSNAGIFVAANLTTGLQNVTVEGNSIVVEGWVDAAVEVTAFSSGRAQGVRVIGNGIRLLSGAHGRHMQVFRGDDVLIANNHFVGAATAEALIITDTTRMSISGNHFIKMSATQSLLEAGGVKGVISDNLFEGGLDAVRAFNSSGLTITGNLIENPVDDAMDLFGCDNTVVVGNVMTGVGGVYIRNFAVSATKIDTNNVKN